MRKSSAAALSAASGYSHSCLTWTAALAYCSRAITMSPSWKAVPACEHEAAHAARGTAVTHWHVAASSSG